MSKLNLTANGKEQELVKSYLEEHASDVLAEKINQGVKIEKDEKTLLSKKTLDGFMKYACEEARKNAEKGSSSACIEESVVYGWAIHYFEEDSIEETLYNEDGTPYKKVAPVKRGGTTSKTVTPPPKPQSSQLSLFDFGDVADATPAEDTEEVIDEEELPTEPEAEKNEELVKEDAIPKVSHLYEEYQALKETYPTAIIALRVGDFYEIFDESAKLVSEKLDLTLTSRDFGKAERTPMVGFPYHRVDVYREQIQKFATVALAECMGNVTIHLRKTTETPDATVNATTGEVIENRPAAVDDFIGILFGIFKNEIEDKRS